MADMSIDEWENELQLLGPWSSFETLVSHLEKGEREAPSFQLLSDYVSSMNPTINRGNK